MNRSALRNAAIAACLLLSGRAQADSREDARRHFRAGMEAVKQGRFDEGIAELRRAYAIRSHPSVLFNIAKAYLEAGRLPEALEAYRQYLAYDPPDADDVRAKVAQLEASLQAPPPGPAPTAAPDGGAPPAADGGLTLEQALATHGAADPRAERMEQLLLRLDGRLERLEEAETERAAAAAQNGGALGAGGPEKKEASEEELGNREDAYEEVVVTASRYAEDAVAAPAALSVITSEEIQLSGATSLPDLLRRVPGLEVVRFGVGSASISARGFDQRVSNKVLVLVDGRSVYEDFLGFTLWDEMPVQMDEIERIEVIRGPAGALYGANAFLGVINVITRRPGSGPALQLRAGAGIGKQGQASGVASVRTGRVRLRASAGWRRSDVWSLDFDPNRTDITPRVGDPALGLQTLSAQLTGTVRVLEQGEIGLQGGVTRLQTEIYPPGVLRNFMLEGLHTTLRGDAKAGPFRLRAFWNRLEGDAGPRYFPPGERTLESHLTTNVVDVDAQAGDKATLLGEHRWTVGAGYRLKTAQWSFLGIDPVQHHFSGLVQDAWQPVSWLSVQGSFRGDRHPLLDGGNPGYALSPRGAVVFTPFARQAFFASVASAFREPTLVESYTRLRVPVPGQPAIAALSEGNTALRPERILAVEAGWRGERDAFGWEVVAYRNQVHDLIRLSPLTRLAAADAYDAERGVYLLGKSRFENSDAINVAYGVELGGKAAPVDGLSLRASASLQHITSDEPAPNVCGTCSEAPTLKLWGGATWRSAWNVDLSADAAFVSGTTWVEREPAASDPTQINSVASSIGGYGVVNARAAWRLFHDKLELGVVATNLAPAHQEHPFGNTIQARAMATVGGKL